MNLFDLFIKIGVDDQASNHISGLSQKLGNGLKTASKIGTAAVAAAATGIAVLTKKSINNYAEYEQLVGGVDTLFKESSRKVQEYAANAFKTAGLSANEYMNTVTSFSASLLQSLEGDTEKAAEYAQQAITDMADNANKMGTDISMIQNAYQGFAKQNYTMLDNLKLGYGGTQQEMYRLMQDAEKLGAKFNSEFYLTDKGSLVADFADITEAIHVIQTEMGITGTTAKEASETISGSVASMKSAWSNLLTGLADDTADYQTLIDNFVSSVETAGGNILPRIEIVLGGVAKLIEGLAPMIAERLPAIIQSVLPGLLNGAINVVNAFSAELPGLIESLVPVIADAAPKIMLAGITLTKSLISGLVKAISNPDTIASIIQAVAEMAKIFIERKVETAKAAIGIIVNIATSLVEHIGEMIPFIMEFVSGIAAFIGENVGPLITSAISIISKFGEGLISHIVDLIPVVLTVVQGIAGFLIDNAGELLTSAISIISTLGGFIVENVTEMLPQIVNFVLGIAQFLMDPTVLVPLVESALELVVSLATGIIQAIPKILPAVLSIIKGISDFVLKNLPMVVEIGIQLLTALISDINTIIAEIVAVLPDIIEAVVATLIGSIPLIIDTGVKLLSSLVDNIDDILVPIVRMLPKLISGIVSALLSPKNIKAIIDAGISLISALLNDIPAITRSLLGSVGEVIRELVRGFTSGDFIRQMIGVGRDLISGIAEGIKNFDLFGSVKNSFDNLVGGVKDFFGIKSPSRKFRDEIGKQLAAGIGVGFDVEMPSVTRLAVNDLDKMTSSLDTEMSTISIQHQGMSGAFAPQVTVNINGADHIDARTLAQEAAEAVSRALQNMTERRAAVYG